MNYLKKALFNEKSLPVTLLIFILLTSCHGDNIADSEAYLSHFIADLWLEGADVMRIIWRDCSKKLVNQKDVIDYKDHFPKFLRCVKKKTLKALDRSLDSDVIPIADGVNLVRFELIDGSGNAVSSNTSSSWTEKQIDEGEWRSLALQRMAKILRTHVIKFDFDDTKIEDKVEVRGRRRHHMTMMMFGVVSIGMVLVPMGFQFLAVLGGKALLLAKMALILASIQGLKKIASSPLNYGFYHTYPFEHYEKRSIDDWPSPTVTPSSLSSLIKTHNSPPKSISSSYKSDKDEERNVQAKTIEHESGTISKPNIVNNMRERSEINVYPGILPSVFTPADAPLPLVDLTPSPSEVQADYTLEMPYNRFRFQSATPVIPP